MSTYNKVKQIAQGQGTYEPQRQNNWLVQILPGAEGPAFQSDEIYIALKSFPFPQEANYRKTIRWFNESRHYAGSVEDFGSLTLQLRDYLDKPIAQKLQEWRRLVWNPEEATVGFASNYKRNGILSLTPPSYNRGDLNSPNVLDNARQVRLTGMWPINFSMSDMDMDDDGSQVLISCDISIDVAYGIDNLAPKIT